MQAACSVNQYDSVKIKTHNGLWKERPEKYNIVGFVREGSTAPYRLNDGKVGLLTHVPRNLSYMTCASYSYELYPTIGPRLVVTSTYPGGGAGGVGGVSDWMYVCHPAASTRDVMLLNRISTSPSGLGLTPLKVNPTQSGRDVQNDLACVVNMRHGNV